jgi:hypothetical protein
VLKGGDREAGTFPFRSALTSAREGGISLKIFNRRFDGFQMGRLNFVAGRLIGHGPGDADAFGGREGEVPTGLVSYVSGVLNEGDTLR